MNAPKDYRVSAAYVPICFKVVSVQCCTHLFLQKSHGEIQSKSENPMYEGDILTTA